MTSLSFSRRCLFCLLGCCWGLIQGITAFADEQPSPLKPRQHIELPDLGLSADNAFSPAQEDEIGKTFLRQLRRKQVTLDDSLVDDYLQNLGAQLASYSDNPYQSFHFFMLKANEINAVAVPGGYIGMNTGLFLHANDENEVASVLAHEISHVTQRHIARSIESAQQWSLPMLAAMISAIAVGIANPQLGQAALTGIMAGQVQHQIDVTRANESEADRVGMQTLARAGYDPMGMPNFFERLQAVNRFNTGNFTPDYLQTHPVTTDRIAESRSLANAIDANQSFSPHNSDLFFLMRARVLVLTHQNPKQLQAQLQESLNTRNFKDERALRYGLALVALQNHQYEITQKQLEWLSANDKPRLLYQHLDIELSLERGAYNNAVEKIQQALKWYPNNTALTLLQAQILLQQQQAAQAKTVLRGLNNQNSPEYYKLLAEAQDKTGDLVESKLALAEFYYLTGSLRIALEQLRQAQRQEINDFYLRSRVEARFKELNEEWAAEREEIEKKEREEQRERGR